MGEGDQLAPIPYEEQPPAVQREIDRLEEVYNKTIAEEAARHVVEGHQGPVGETAEEVVVDDPNPDIIDRVLPRAAERAGIPLNKWEKYVHGRDSEEGATVSEYELQERYFGRGKASLFRKYEAEEEGGVDTVSDDAENDAGHDEGEEPKIITPDQREEQIAEIYRMAKDWPGGPKDYFSRHPWRAGELRLLGAEPKIGE